MPFMTWLDKRVARMNWMDVGLLKICVIALMIAKLWPIILTPHWAMFAFVFLLAYAPLKQVQIGKLTEMLGRRRKRRKKRKPVGFSAWMDARIANLDAVDVGILKAAVFILTLLAAKLWPVLLLPDWQVLGGIFLVTYVPLVLKLVVLKDGHA